MTRSASRAYGVTCLVVGLLTLLIWYGNHWARVVNQMIGYRDLGAFKFIAAAEFALATGLLLNSLFAQRAFLALTTATGTLFLVEAVLHAREPGIWITIVVGVVLLTPAVLFLFSPLERNSDQRDV